MGRSAELADKLLREEEEEDEEDAKRARVRSATAAVPPPSMPVRSATIESPIVTTTITDPLSSSPPKLNEKRGRGLLLCFYSSLSCSLKLLFFPSILGFSLKSPLLVAIWGFAR